MNTLNTLGVPLSRQYRSPIPSSRAHLIEQPRYLVRRKRTQRLARPSANPLGQGIQVCLCQLRADVPPRAFFVAERDDPPPVIRPAAMASQQLERPIIILLAQRLFSRRMPESHIAPLAKRPANDSPPNIRLPNVWKIIHHSDMDDRIGSLQRTPPGKVLPEQHEPPEEVASACGEQISRRRPVRVHGFAAGTESNSRQSGAWISAPCHTHQFHALNDEVDRD